MRERRLTDELKNGFNAAMRQVAKHDGVTKEMLEPVRAYVNTLQIQVYALQDPQHNTRDGWTCWHDNMTWFPPVHWRGPGSLSEIHDPG